jgi:hypothetical protein
MEINFRKEEPSGWAIEESMACPICKKRELKKDDYNFIQHYNHVYEQTKISGNDNYEAWCGRGDLYKIKFWCEAGHAFSLCFGEHKGNIMPYWKIEDYEPYKNN